MVAALRILVVGPAWVGDMVMAQSLFMTLVARGAKVDVVAPEWSLPLLARMPEVCRAVALPVGHGSLGLAERWRIGRALRAEHYDQAIVLPRSFKAALIPFFARIPHRTGYRGEMRYGLINDRRELDKVLLPRVVQRYVALGLPADAVLPPPEIPLPHLRVDADNRARLVEELGLDLARPAVALLPGAEYGPAKRWPLEYYAALARELLTTGRQVWVIGSAKERVDGDAIVAGAPGTLNLCGRTRLEDALDLLSLAAAAVSNDSGLMHVAAAVGIPLVALYGSSSPDYTPPLSSQATIAYLHLDCSPCYQRECKYGHYQCLRGIEPAAVLPLLEEHLKHESA